MEIETTIAKSVRAAEDKARYDALCKKLLAEKWILAWILKTCVEEYRDVEVEDIAERYIEGKPRVSDVAVYPDEGRFRASSDVTEYPDEGRFGASDVAGYLDEERTRMSNVAEYPDKGRPSRILGLGTEDVSAHEGTIYYDIRFYAIAPKSGEQIRLIINVESQYDFYPGYALPTRGVYYLSRLISAQYGTEFTNAHYEKLKKVYSIWICSRPPKNRENAINRYRIREEHIVGTVKEPESSYDLMTMVMIYLGEAEAAEQPNNAEALQLLNVLLSATILPEKKKQILQEEFRIPMTEEMESEVGVMCNLSEGVWQDGIAKGRAEGRVEGRAEGRAEGMTENLVQNVKKTMATLGWSADQVMDMLEVSEADRQIVLGRL